MIELICGRAGSGKSEYILQSIRRALDSGRQRLILIVPEQQAVVWETRIARELPPSAALRLEIVSFTRLCNLVGRTYGGLAENCITRGGKAALMWTTLRSLSDSLQVYGGKRAERTVPAILRAVSEMKRSGVTPAMLQDAADHLEAQGEGSHLVARARDLSLITSVYTQLVAQRYDDSEDALAHLAERLKTEPFFAGCDVFVDSFFSLTPVEDQILYHILRQADHVSVTFACPAKATDEPQFASPRAFYKKMKQAAQRMKRECATVELTENHRAGTPRLAYLERHLWNFSADPYTPAKGDDPASVRMIRTADRYAEADAAACRIQALVREGAKYSDIAIIARSADKLRGILDVALARRGIPYFFSEHTDMTTRPAARLLLAALAVAGGGWRREDVILCAKTGLCSLTDAECDALEIYTDTWRIRGEKSFSIPWNNNPDGYTKDMTKRGQRILTHANRGRDKLIPPLSHFTEVFQGGTAAVPEIARACYELLCEYGVWDSLRRTAEDLSRAGRAREASEHAQLWDLLMEALDTLADTLPDARADAQAFAALLRQVLSTMHIGAIPGGMDEVVIGSADQVRLGEIPHVLLLGAVEGEFPASVTDDGFFTDTDKVLLEGEGIVLSAKTEDRMKEELLWFYRALCLAHRSVTVFLPATDGGDACSPSLAAQRIRALLPDLETENFAAWDAADTVFTPMDARDRARLLRGTEAGEALIELGIIPAKAASIRPLHAQDESVSEETAALLFPREMSLTQSRLDSFIQCHFGYYCKYLMKLDEEKEASLTQMNVGTFVHRVLELFFAEQKGQPLPTEESVIRAETDRIVTRVIDEILPEGDPSGRAKYLFTRLTRCVYPMLASLAHEFAQSRFRPAFFELPMGEDDENSVPPRHIATENGHTVYLTGVVDRLDTWQDGDTTYVRVVDYKTGSKKFARSDVEIGINVQLLLYLFSVLRCPPGKFREKLTGKPDGEIRAAGALYFSARPGETSSDTLISREDAIALAEENVDRSGVLLSDETVLRAMERDLGGKYIPATQGKKGIKSSAALSGEEMEQLEQTMIDSIARVGGEMCSGAAEARPMKLHGKDPCTYCIMKEVCRAAGGEDNE